MVWFAELLGQKTFRSVYSVPKPIQLVGKNRAGFLNKSFDPALPLRYYEASRFGGRGGKRDGSDSSFKS